MKSRSAVAPLTAWNGTRVSWNVMKPRIQCVLTQWNPGFSASGGGIWGEWDGFDGGEGWDAGGGLAYGG